MHNSLAQLKTTCHNHSCVCLTCRASGDRSAVRRWVTLSLVPFFPPFCRVRSFRIFLDLATRWAGLRPTSELFRCGMVAVMVHLLL